MTTVAEVIEAIESRFPPHLAEDWDVNGLTVGSPHATVETVLFAVDPTVAVVEEAIDAGAQLLVTHHPLMLRGVHTVASTTPAGAVVERLIRGGCALFNAHTNADAAVEGVAEALALALGVRDPMPLIPHDRDPRQGSGRIGNLAIPMTLEEFGSLVAQVLPSTAHGVRLAGDLTATIRRVAVVGGAGDSFLDTVASTDADVYVTADLRHHPALTAREIAALGDGKPYLVDVAHFASEWSWLDATAEHIADVLSLNTIVSTTNTDPWTARVDATDA